MRLQSTVGISVWKPIFRIKLADTPWRNAIWYQNWTICFDFIGGLGVQLEKSPMQPIQWSELYNGNWGFNECVSFIFFASRLTFAHGIHIYCLYHKWGWRRLHKWCWYYNTQPAHIERNHQFVMTPHCNGPEIDANSANFIEVIDRTKLDHFRKKAVILFDIHYWLLSIDIYSLWLR